jgi:hypothetical protein
MPQQAHQTAKRHWFSLSMRISLGLVGAAVIPLFVMLIFTNMQTRPALVDQANKAMTSDAQTRVQLIDNYFRERLADTLTISRVPGIMDNLQLLKYPGTNQIAQYSAQKTADFTLQAGMARNKDYKNWTFFDTDGKILSTQPENKAPEKHGNDYIPAPYLKNVLERNIFISSVYKTSDGKNAAVDIYTPLTTTTMTDNSKPSVFAVLRVTLKLDYIWNEVVQKDLGSNGSGSYAFILDENGIRIADTDASRLFTGVETLAANVQEQRFGNQQNVKILPDQRMAASINQQTSSDTFQTQPAGQNEQFQVVRQDTTNAYIHWHYFVLSPIATTTDVANQQLRSITLVAVLASLIVALTGWFVGRNMARPILRAVADLRKSSAALNTLSTNQQEGASEQVWVEYYTNAAKVALNQLGKMTIELALYWRKNHPQKIDQALEQALEAIRYMEKALEHQHNSNQKLGTALKVATQVTEQLHQGALSATQAATQLEDVVQRLLTVAGQRQNDLSVPHEEQSHSTLYQNQEEHEPV